MLKTTANINQAITLEQTKEHQDNFAAFINSTIEAKGLCTFKPKSKVSGDNKMTIGFMNESENKEEFIKSINAEDLGFGLIQSHELDKTVEGSINDLDLGLAKFFDKTQNKIIHALMHGFVSQAIPALGGLSGTLKGMMAGGMHNMLKLSAGFAKLAMDLTENIRPQLGSTKAEWQAYGQTLSEILRNSFETIKKFGKLHKDTYIRFLNRYNIFKDDLTDSSGFYSLDKKDFEIANDTIKLKPELIRDWLNGIIQNPTIKNNKDGTAQPMYKNPRIPNLIKAREGCMAFNVKFPKVENYVSDTHMINICLDWVARIYEKTLFANLDKVFKSMDASNDSK